jgi:hypothetical protein
LLPSVAAVRYGWLLFRLRAVAAVRLVVASVAAVRLVVTSPLRLVVDTRLVSWFFCSVFGLLADLFGWLLLYRYVRLCLVDCSDL